jgi:hypothetical protein
MGKKGIKQTARLRKANLTTSRISALDLDQKTLEIETRIN